MKNRIKKHKNYKRIFPFLLFLSTLFIGIGYASVNSVILDISGSLSAKSQDGIFITEVNYKSDVSADYNSSRIISAYQTMLNSNIYLSKTDAKSQITYSVTIYNSNDNAYAFDKADYLESADTYSNEDITFKIDGLNHGDIIDSKESITFSITFCYKDGILSSNNNLKSLLIFKFEYVTKPVLASNMVPVIYENNSWQKVEPNSGNWHSYLSGKWANAITYNHNLAYNKASNDNELKQFNGTSDDFVYLGSPNYNFGKKITIVTRFKIYEYGTEVQGLIGNVESAGFYLGVTAAGKIRFRIYESANVNKTLYSKEAIKLDTWYTIVATYDGSVIRLYSNGILEDSIEYTSDISVSVAPIVIGGNPNKSGITTSGFFKGTISEVAVMDDILDAKEISKNYGNKIYHIPDQHSVLYYLKFDGDYGVVAHSAQYTSEGMLFDGVDDYVSLGHSMYDFNNSFTVAARVKFLSSSDTSSSIIGNQHASGFTLLKTSSDIFRISVYDNAISDYVRLNSNMKADLNTWYTIVVTYDGSLLNMYIDGNLEGSLPVVIELKYGFTPIMLGVNPSYKSKLDKEYLNGIISDVMVIDEALTENQISTYYASNLDTVISDKTLINYNLRSYETRENGFIIPEEMINAMWVWVPRFNAVTPTDVGKIDLTIVEPNKEAHDSFTFADKELDGFWIGKFENSSLISYESDASNVDTNSNILIKPNNSSLKNKNISTVFNKINNITSLSDVYGFDITKHETINTHLIKNNEWSAIAYLSQSKYGLCNDGTCKELANNSSGITGGVNYLSNITQSNTQNIYGIYDLNGGVNEFTMGNYSNTLNSLDGFSNLPDPIYLNVYTTEEEYLFNKYQHSMFETNNIFNNSTFNFINSTTPWLVRNGLFSYDSSTGANDGNIGSRTVLVVK